jgi:hypothetical protein
VASRVHRWPSSSDQLSSLQSICLSSTLRYLWLTQSAGTSTVSSRTPTNFPSAPGVTDPVVKLFRVCWRAKGFDQFEAWFNVVLTATRSDGSNYITITQVIFQTTLFEGDLRWHLCQWMVQRSGRDRWTLQNMWYPASEGSWYLSGVLGATSLATTPFEWEIHPDRLGGHRYFFNSVHLWSGINLVGRIVHPGTKQVLSSVGSIGNGYIQVTLQSPDCNKDSQRWTIE